MNSNTIESKITLGVVAISLNEEIDLPGFLKNISGWADEIVIVDCGSQDNTIEIIKSSNIPVKIINSSLTEAGGYAGLRNLGLKSCTSDWIINMDIDERISSKLKLEILKAIRNDFFDAYKYKRLNYFLHRPMKYGGWNTWNNPQLARRGSHYYDGVIHEKCVVHGNSVRIGQLTNLMIHLNDESYSERLNKSFKYCHMEAELLCKNNKKVYWPQFFILPTFEFIKKYFLKMGFLDGIPGLISAIHSSNAVFRILALTWDNQNKIPRCLIEREIN